MEFIKRDIPRWEEYEIPEDPECWYNVYCNLLERVQKSVEEDAERLKMALDGINSERAKHTSKFVTDRRSSIRLPRERPTARQRYAMFDRKMRGGGPAAAGRMNNNMMMGSTKKRGHHSNIFAAPKVNPALAVPTKQLNSKATQVTQAPLSLIEHHRSTTKTGGDGSQKSASRPPPVLIAPGRSSHIKGGGSNLSLHEREERLRALTSPLKPLHSPSRSSQAKEPTTSSLSLHEREARLRALTSPSKSLPSPSSPSSQAKGPTTSNASLHEGDPSSKSTTLPPPPQFLPPPSASPKEPVETKSSGESTPRPVIMRKRPPSSVFIQPKKKTMYS